MHSILDAAIGYVLGGICVFPTLGVVRDSPGNRQYSHSRRRLKRTAHRTRSPRQESRSQRGIFSRSIPLQKLFRFESSHFASKLVSIEADRLLDRATPGTSPLPPDENTYRGGNHPPYCTCAACTADRLGRISQPGPTATAKRILRAVQRVLRLGR